MIRNITFATILLLAATPAASRADVVSLARLWPAQQAADIRQTGRGVAVVFSPDISVPGNCAFYESLGFACFDSADWNFVIEGIRRYNVRNREHPIRTLVLETHGTNGHGLKLQTGKDPDDDRSYISVGGLQERLERLGVKHIVITACNSQRLLRPQILRTLNPNPGDDLFLPATCGINGASEKWDSEKSDVAIVTPSSSRIETTLVGSVAELSPSVRDALGKNLPKRFAVSDLLIQMLTRDKRLELQSGRHTEKLSEEIVPPAMSERLFERFLAHLETLVARTPQTASR